MRDVAHETAEGNRSERLRTLLERFRKDALTLDEAYELLGYIEEDLEKAKSEGDRASVRVIRRYKGGVESYIALREGPGSIGNVDPTSRRTRIKE